MVFTGEHRIHTKLLAGQQDTGVICRDNDTGRRVHALCHALRYANHHGDACNISQRFVG
jgi:hypothetical protein